MADQATVMEVALCLRKISRDLRSAGDVPLVLMDPDGVAPADVTLSDELWLLAFSLDPRLTTEEDDRG